MVAIVGYTALHWRGLSSIPPAYLWQIAFMAANSVLFLIGLAIFENRRNEFALRVNDHHVELFAGDRKLATSTLADVIASGTALLIGSRQIYYRPMGAANLRGATIFDEALLQQALLARLPESNLVTNFGMFKALLQRNALVKAAFVVFVLGAAYEVAKSALKLV